MKFYLRVLFVLVNSLYSFIVVAESGQRTLFLSEAERMALEVSPDSVLADSYIQSLNHKVNSIDSYQYPKIVLEGNYKYVETVPELSTQAGKISLGDNQNYDFGPAIILNLFDGGAVRNTVKSLKKLRASKFSEKIYVESIVLLAVRLAYLNVLVSGEQYNLALASFNLSKIQNLDIKRKRKLGALSQLDLSLSNRDFINQKLKMLDAKKTLKKSVIDLSVLISKDSNDPILYVPSEFFSDFGRPLQFNSLEQIVGFIETKQLSNTNLPAQIIALDQRIKSVQEEIKAEKSKQWPQVSLKIKSSFDYPNGPQLERIHQNIIGLNLTMPLYDGGERLGIKSTKLAEVEGLKAQKRKLERDINRDIKKLKLELHSLKEQELLVEDLVTEAKNIVKINLISFNSGKIKFTEVERANVKKFEAQVRRLILKGQIFSKLSQIIALSQGGLR